MCQPSEGRRSPPGGSSLSGGLGAAAPRSEAGSVQYNQWELQNTPVTTKRRGWGSTAQRSLVYCCALRGSPLPHRPPRVSSLAANCAAESTTCDYAMSNEEAMRGDHFNRFSSIAKVLLQMLQQRHHDYIKTRTAATHRTRWILSHACFPGRPPPRIFSRPPLHSSTSFSPSW